METDRQEVEATAAAAAAITMAAAELLHHFGPERAKHNYHRLTISRSTKQNILQAGLSNNRQVAVRPYQALPKVGKCAQLSPHARLLVDLPV